MAKMTKPQKKRAAKAMLQKAEKLYLADGAITLDDVAKVMAIKQRALKRLGYKPGE